MLLNQVNEKVQDIVKYEQVKRVCKKCNTILKQESEGVCKNCGFRLKETQFEEGQTFHDTKLVGQKDQQMGLSELNRDQKIEDKLEMIMNSLDLEKEYRELVGDTPMRILKFAYQACFLDQGSSILNYCVAALYISLRFFKAPFLLMDFSDKLSINVFKLGRNYKKLAKFLNVTMKLSEKLPTIDPSVYIPRFCQMMENVFQEKTNQVRETANKLLKRMKMDWMAHGRRPSSLCGAAILIAAWNHDFKNITVKEVASKVLVCEETLRKRLEEFKETKTATLTYEQFEEIDIEKIGSEMDPPAFRNRKMSIKEIIEQDIEKVIAGEQFEVEGEQNENLVQNQKLEKQKVELNLSLQNGIVPKMQNTKLENILNEPGYINYNSCLDSDLSDDEKYILSEKEQQIKKIIWDDLNKEWIREQSLKNPNKVEKKKTHRKLNRRNDQLLNNEDPIENLVKSKKIKKNMDENILKEYYQVRIKAVNNTKIQDVFGKENPPDKNPNLNIHNYNKERVLRQNEKIKQQEINQKIIQDQDRVFINENGLEYASEQEEDENEYEKEKELELEIEKN